MSKAKKKMLKKLMQMSKKKLAKLLKRKK